MRSDAELDPLALDMTAKLQAAIMAASSYTMPPSITAKHITAFVDALDRYIDARALRITRLIVVEALREVLEPDHK